MTRSADKKRDPLDKLKEEAPAMIRAKAKLLVELLGDFEAKRRALVCLISKGI